MKVGQKIITLYFILYYFIPLLGNYFFSDYIASSYVISPLNVMVISKLIVIYCAYLFMSNINITFSFSTFNTFFNRTVLFYKKYRLIIALIVLCFAVIFFKYGLNTYRYGPAITEHHSPILIICILLHVIISIDILYNIFMREGNQKIRTYIENILLILAMLLFSNGTASLIEALLMLVFSIFPSKTNQLLFSRDESKVTLKIIFSRISIGVLLLLCIGGLAWFTGEIIKMKSGGNSTKEAIYIFKESLWNPTLRNLYPKEILKNQQAIKPNNNNNAFRSFIFGYLLERISIDYYSLLFTSQPEEYKTYINEHPIVLIFKTLLFRLNYITGNFFEVARPMIGSISQLNYILLVKSDYIMEEKIQFYSKIKAGSSPGLISSFDYMFNFPLNIIFCVLYIVIISHCLNNIFTSDKKNIRLSLIGLLVLFSFVMVLLRSPFDFLILIDNASLLAALLLFISLNKKPKQFKLA